MLDFLDRIGRKVFGTFGECLPDTSDPMPDDHLEIQRERASIAKTMDDEVQKLRDHINGVTTRLKRDDDIDATIKESHDFIGSITRPKKVSKSHPIRDPVPDVLFGLWI